MFDIGFAEILVIGVVGLIVIGPNRLPETIRTAALWMGRARRTYSQFRRDLEQEIGADDIRRDLRNEEIMEQLKNTKEQFEQSFSIENDASEDKSSAPEQKPLSQNKPPADKTDD